MKVYVGATFSLYEDARAVIDEVMQRGHVITCDWTRTDFFGPDGHPRPGTGGGYDLDPAEGRRYAEEDVRAVKEADLCLFLAHQASCGWPVECGVAAGEGKDIIVVAPFKYTVFWDLPNVRVVSSVEEALGWLDKEVMPT